MGEYKGVSGRARACGLVVTRVEASITFASRRAVIPRVNGGGRSESRRGIEVHAAEVCTV